MEFDTGMAIMSGSDWKHDAKLPLELRGYENNTAQDVFILTRPLDAQLALTLEEQGYVRRSNIALTDGRIVDGWVRI